MNRIKFITFALLLVCSTSAWAQKDYKASMFGIKSDGTTLNTGSIQKAVDYISENGGGRLVFYVGRYLTGTINLKSNVTIQLEEGAGLMASTSTYDYDFVNGNAALIIAKDQQNVGVTGKGLIDGQGISINANIDEQTRKNNLPTGQASFRPLLICMDNCTNVTLSDILMYNAGGDVQAYSGCKNIDAKNITVKSNVLPSTKGIVLTGCSGVKVTDSFVDVPSVPVSLKGASSKDVKVLSSVTADGRKIQPK